MGAGQNRRLETDAEAGGVSCVTRGYERDIVDMAHVRPSARSGEVDTLDEGREALAELIARAAVELAVGLDVSRVAPLSARLQELVAPVVGETRLDAVLVVEQDSVGTIAQTLERELKHA